MRHTPGPWKVEGVDIYAPAPANVRPHIARVIYGGKSDARLIAAAPELLEALKRYVEWQEGKFDAIDIEAEILAPAKAAIAKAEGKEE